MNNISLKDIILSGYVVEFKNGNTLLIDNKNMWVINRFYDDELNCLQNPDYDIIRIYKEELLLLYDKTDEVVKR